MISGVLFALLREELQSKALLGLFVHRGNASWMAWVIGSALANKAVEQHAMTLVIPFVLEVVCHHPRSIA
jgi:hypothetical protein